MAYAKSTLEKIARYEAEGYTVICGNNPFLNKTRKWAGHECIRLAQTNSRYHGRCISTVWAVKPR